MDQSIFLTRTGIMKTILVFDRYPNMLEAFHRFLSQQNYRVLTTESLEEVVMVIEVVRVDMVIMDAGMVSEVSILKTVREIRKRNLRLPILLTATYSDTLTENRARQLGAAHFMLKPFDPTDMKRVVRQLVQKGQGN
jgi:DNA-binding NtrC family response regulator